MTTYNTYKIINLDEFEATGLVSRTVEATLAGIGLKEILVTKGNFVSLLYEGILLSLGIGEENFFEFEGHAVFLDPNNDIYLGIAVEE